MKKFISVLMIAVMLVGCRSESRLVGLAEDAKPKTVMVYVSTIVPVFTLTFSEKGIEIEQSTRTVRMSGSGVLVSPNGHVLTAQHLLVGDVQEITVNALTGGYKAECLYAEEKTDLMLLKIEAATSRYVFPYAKVADPRSLKVGQDVFAVGNPLGLEWTVTHGIISRLNTDEVGYNMTQSDTFINPGNSGGPLFNYDGELIGINSRMVPPVNAAIFTGLGFSTQSGQIIEFLTRFKGLERIWNM